MHSHRDHEQQGQDQGSPYTSPLTCLTEHVHPGPGTTLTRKSSPAPENEAHQAEETDLSIKGFIYTQGRTTWQSIHLPQAGPASLYGLLLPISHLCARNSSQSEYFRVPWKRQLNRPLQIINNNNRSNKNKAVVYLTGSGGWHGVFYSLCKTEIMPLKIL